jgi:hypothetical protein
MKSLAARLTALAVYNLTTIVGASALLGGAELWKAVAVAGANTLPVVAMLAKAYYTDGKITKSEEDIAFGAGK